MTRYRELPPGPALARHVACFWTLGGSAPTPTAPARVLPDGCCDILFDLGEGSRVEGEGRPGAFAVGTMTKAIRVHHGRAADLVAVRFRPAAATPFLGAPATDLVDGWVELAELWGEEAGELEARLAGTTSTEVRLRTLRAALERRLEADRRRPSPREDALALRAAALLAAVPTARTGSGATASPDPASLDPGAAVPGASTPASRPTHATSVAGVARTLGVSRRHVERRIREHVGLSPGALRRVTRLRRAADGIAASGRTLAEVAQAAGYHDQAHMNRDFADMAGLTPGAYRRELRARARVPSQAETPVASVQDPDGSGSPD